MRSRWARGVEALLVVAVAAVTVAVGAWTSDVAGVPRSEEVRCVDEPVPDIFRVEMAGAEEEVETLLGGPCGEARLEEMVRRDSLFIFTYAVLLGYLTLWGANRFRSGKMRVAGTVLFAGVLAVGALDVLENVALGRIAEGHRDAATAATAATAAAVGKWLLLLPVAGYALAAFVTMVVRVFDPALPLPLPAEEGHEIDFDGVWGPDELRAAQDRLSSPVAIAQDELARWWWASRPPRPIGWEAPRQEGDHVLGIAFSGGGIRSASFNLGCLQACQVHPPPSPLKGDDVLSSSRYLAAVSGGGYLASGRQLAVHRGRDLPFAADSREEGDLKKNGRYLWATWAERGAGLVRIVGGMLLNLAVPLALVFLVGRSIGWMATASGLITVTATGFSTAPAPTLVLLGPVAAMVTVTAVAWLVRGLPSMVGAVARGVAVTVGISAGAGLMASSLLLRQGAAVLVPVALALVGFLGIVAVRGLGQWKTLGGLVPATAAFISGLLWVRAGARADWGATWNATPLILAVATGFVVVLLVFGAWIWAVAEAPTAGWRRVVPAALGTIGVAAAGVWVSRRLIESGLDLSPDLSERTWFLVVAAALAFAFLAIDQVRWSPHRFYKQRILHAFGERADATVRFSDLRANLVGPDLLTCAAVHLPGKEYGRRNVGSFTFSRELVGGPDIGWVRTAAFEQALKSPGEEDVTVASAMAASGAAVASANGYMDLGAMNALLALANARLGVWLPNPTHIHELFGHRPAPEGKLPSWARIRRLSYLFKEVFGVYDSMDRFVYVTDGGHHDNLALIELLRRRCDTVLCFDASGGDNPRPTTLYEVRDRAQAELGVKIEPLDREREARLAAGEERVAVFRVSYPAVPAPEDAVGAALPAWEGRLVYARCHRPPGATDAPPEDEAEGRWPHDGTHKQWFSSSRIEAYRLLGAQVAAEAIALWRSSGQP